MQLPPERIDAWLATLSKGKKKWPERHVLSRIAASKEVHYFTDVPRVLAARIPAPDDAVVLLTTSARLKQGPVAEEIAGVRDALTSWKPKAIVVGWTLNDQAMAGQGGQALAEAVLAGITKRKIRYVSYSGFLTTHLEQLFAATSSGTTTAKKKTKK